MSALSLGMAKKMKAERGHPFPAPTWWIAAIGKVRDMMSDRQLIEAIEEQTGNVYTKFTISRYFAAKGATTTLELTNDLWLTFGAKHAIPRPVVVAQTRDEADVVTAVLSATLRGEMAKFEDRLRRDEAARHSDVLDSTNGSSRRVRPAVVGGRAGSVRR